MDFFGIGAPRCGSTWLATCIDEHPEAAISRPKEPDFFVRQADVFKTYTNPRYLRDWRWYASLWPPVSASTLRGDFSINMMHNVESAPQAVRDHFPDAKLIAVLRNPVARTYSHYWYHYGMHRHWGGIPETFRQAVEHEGLVWRSRYHSHLEKWLEHFPRKQLHVVLDLDARGDPAGTVRQTYRFLGIDEDFEPPSLRTRINSTRRRRGFYGAAYRTSQRLRRVGLGPMIDLAKRMKVERALNRWDVVKKPPPPMDARAARILAHRLLPEIEGLERLLGRDLSAWKQAPSEPSPQGAEATPELEVHLRPPPRRAA